MAKYRQLYTEFWSDGFVIDLTPEEKYFYLYLMTNSKTSQCGIYELPKRIIETETGYNRETVDKLIQRFTEYNKILYCNETKEIMIMNWIRYNSPNNANAIKCVNRELSKIKNTDFLKVLYGQCKSNNLDCESIFEGLNRGLQGAYEDMDNTQEGACDGVHIVNDDNSPCSHESQSYQQVSDFNNGISRGYEGACEGLPSNKVINNKEEIMSNKQKTMSNKEEVINNKGENNVSYAETDDADFSAVIKVFENNVHPITPIEYERLVDWSREVSCNVIIMAIEEAVNYNARTMKYIDSILNCWLSKGIRTINGVRAYMKEWEERRKASSGKGQGKNGFCDYEQRNYNFDKLEKGLLGWEA